MIRRVHYLILAVLFSLVFLSPVVLAASPSPCATGTSNEDCASVIGNWTQWVAEAGTCSASSTPSGSSSTSLTGADNIQKAYNFFMTAGFSPLQAAAIVGNLQFESGGLLDPKVNQGSGGPGRGIAQWTFSDRWQEVIKYAQQLSQQTGTTVSEYDLGVQLSFVMLEMNSQPPATGNYTQVRDTLKQQTDITQATGFFMGTAAANSIDSVAASFIAAHGRVRGYENPGTTHLDFRVNDANKILSQYGGSAGAVSGTNAAVCNTSTSTAVDCTSSNPSDTQGLSATRQKIVCLAQAEYKLWQSGAMGPGKPGTSGFLKYTQGRNEEWCADFVSWVYNQAGDPLGSAKDGNVASVSNVEAIGRQNGKFTFHAAGSYTPVPGDLLIHGTDHVNMVISVNTANKTMVEIGGNQGGIRDNSMSLVSQGTYNNYTADGITGYVSPQ